MKKIHRILAFFLCLILLFSVVVSPIQANAAIVGPDPFASTAFAFVGGVAVDLFSEGAKLVASALVSATDAVTNVVSNSFLVDCYNIAVAFASKSPATFEKAYNSFLNLSLKPMLQMTLDEEFCEGLQEAVQDTGNTQIQVPAAGTQIYVPPDSVWLEAEYLTYDRLVNSGFAELETLNENVVAGNMIANQTLKKVMALTGYLRGDFIDTLTKELNDVEAWVNRLNSNLVDKFVSLQASIAVDLGQVKSGLALLNTTLQSEIADGNTLLGTLNADLSSLLDNVHSAVTSMKTTVSSDLVNVKSAVSSLQGALTGDIADLKTTLSDQLAQVNSSLANLPASMETLIKNINTWDRTLIDRVMENLQQIKTYQVDARDVIAQNLQQVKNYQVLVYDRIYDTVTGVNTNITSLKTNVVYRLQQVEAVIKDLPGKLGSLDDALLEQLEDIGAKLGSISLPTIVSPDTSFLDAWNRYRNQLMDFVDSGFSSGLDSFGSVDDFLSDDFDAFRVAALVFGQFAGIGFFHKLIVLSCSIGFIGTLLGMALDVKSFSVAQRRRQEADRARAYQRMQIAKLYSRS